MDASWPNVEIPEPWGTLAVIAVVFFGAWLVSRWSERLAARIVRRLERRTGDPEEANTGVLTQIKRRETAISLTRTTVRYAAYLVAVFVAIVQLSGLSRGTAVAGASLLVLLLGFAAQRFLTDVLSGMFMFFEGWFSVGDAVIVEPWDLSGVVEEVSLRATKLRAVNGETLRVHNSQILAVRVLPRGVREVSIELFVRDEAAGRRLIEEVAQLVPTGPTNFVRPPWVESSDRLADDLAEVRARATTIPGREWLVTEFLASVIRERAADDLIVHGPVVMDVDEQAARRYARSLGRAGITPVARR